MCKHEQGDSAKKSRTWLQQRPTDKQQKMLNNKFKHDYSMTKYRATALIKWKFYGSLIRDIALIEGRRVA